MYDSDKAGQMATLRSIDLLLEEGLKVEVVNMPAGSDPDSLIRQKGKDGFDVLLKQRQDFFDYKLDALKKTYDPAAIDGKTKITKEMLPTLNKLNSEVQKYEYIKKLASNLGVKEEIMIAEFRSGFPAGSSPYKNRFISSKQLSSAVKEGPLTITEKVVLKFMFTSSKAFSLIKKNLKEEYFDSALARKTVSFFFNAYTEKNYFNPTSLGMIDDKEIRGFISKILMDDGIPFDKNTFKESLLKLRSKSMIQRKKELRAQIQEAEAKGDAKRLKILVGEYGKANNEVENG